MVTCNIAAAGKPFPPIIRSQMLVHPLLLLRTPTALVFYDYALTFDQEVRIIWRAARFSSPALLFYVVRYAAFFSSILIVLDVTEWPGQNDLVRPSPSNIYLRSADLRLQR